ncbi:hypothetical protein MGWOODY_Clf2483 [hydrothermal vent metagenome]|uniref:Uncharacterized protein n=1 Tax=hydrothermal vent metagenome TaxID=652676 RepID=A0A170QA67_9ZZZZ
MLEPSMFVVPAPQATREPMAQKKAAPQTFQPRERVTIQFLVFIQQKL